MVLVLSLVVIIAVAAVVGRVCGRSRPGERHSSVGSSWPGGVDVSDGSVHHHGGSTAHTHDSGGWGGDAGGGDSGGGDSGGGGGGD